MTIDSTNRKNHKCGNLVLLAKVGRNDRTTKLPEWFKFTDFSGVVLYYYYSIEKKLIVIPTIQINPEKMEVMMRYNFHENSFVDFEIIDESNFRFENCSHYSLYQVYGIY